MKVLTALFSPTDAVERARLVREAGGSGVFTFEGPHDVFAPLTLASTVGGLDLMTNVAIAFPRNPVQLAHQAYDHQLLSGGRFTLGLGTQIRTQVEKRYGASFDQPVARMRELVGALRAIFDAWQGGGRLDFRGRFYRHTLMTPTFNPGPNPFGPPPIYLGALGPRLTTTAAEVADGLLVMPFGTARYLREATMPAVRAGLAARTEDAGPVDFAVVPEVIVSPGDDHTATRRLRYAHPDRRRDPRAHRGCRGGPGGHGLPLSAGSDPARRARGDHRRVALTGSAPTDHGGHRRGDDDQRQP